MAWHPRTVIEEDLLAHTARQLLDVLVLHRVVHEDALASAAALTGAHVAGVVHDHQRAVAAHLEQGRLACGACPTSPPSSRSIRSRRYPGLSICASFPRPVALYA